MDRKEACRKSQKQTHSIGGRKGQGLELPYCPQVHHEPNEKDGELDQAVHNLSDGLGITQNCCLVLSDLAFIHELEYFFFVFTHFFLSVSH